VREVAGNVAVPVNMSTCEWPEAGCAVARSRVRGRLWWVGGLLGIMLPVVMVTPALSHQSFAMYDQTVTKVMTGRLWFCVFRTCSAG
jgi:hypothetical protein